MDCDWGHCLLRRSIIFGLFFVAQVSYYKIFDDLHFNHSIWHVCVMVGTFAHFVSIVLTVFIEQHLAKGQLTPQVKLSAKKAMKMLFSLQRPTHPTPTVPRKHNEE
jgi:hypothetical protein